MEPADTLEKLSLHPAVDGQLWPHTRRDRPTRTRAHRHIEPEFNLTIGGQAAYLLHDRRSEVTRRYPMRRGSLIFLYPEQEHVLIEPSSDFSMWIGVVTPEAAARLAATLRDADDLVSAYPPHKVGAWLSEADTRRLETLLAETHREGPSAGADFDIGLFNVAMAYVVARAWSLYRLSEEMPTGSAVHPAVAEAARLIRDEPSALLLNALAQRVGISPSHLSLLFHQQTGETIAAFRNRQRIERFLSQGESHGTLLERALAAGFGSYAQFHRVYREMTGHAPSRAG